MTDDRRQKRIEMLNGYLAVNPDDSFSRFALAIEYQADGDIGMATSLLEELKTRDANYVGTYYQLAAMYRLQSRSDDAKTVYQEGIAIANAQNDAHARSELQSALSDLEFDAE